jgi:hypothetical protein
MKAFENFIKRQTISLPLMTVMFPVLYMGAEIGLIASGAVAAGTYIASNTTVKQIQFSSDSKKLGMTRSEYKHIRHQVKEAKNKIKQLQGNYYRVRSIASFKQLMELTRFSNKIVQSPEILSSGIILLFPFGYGIGIDREVYASCRPAGKRPGVENCTAGYARNTSVDDQCNGTGFAESAFHGRGETSDGT